MYILIKIIFIFIISALAACSDANTDGRNRHSTEKASRDHQETLSLTVYKSPTCGCCEQWIDHINSDGIDTKIRNHQSLAPIKNKFYIPSKLQSCHTNVSENGFFFEGHIPAKYIHAFIANPPAGAVGLAVQGMPMGSPGMGSGVNFQPYKIYLVNKDGSVEVYAEVKSYEEQFNEV